MYINEIERNQLKIFLQEKKFNKMTFEYESSQFDSQNGITSSFASGVAVNQKVSQ